VLLKATVAVGVFLALAPAAAASAPRAVLVRFAPDATAADRQALRDRAGAKLEEVLPLRGLQLVQPGPGSSATETVRRLERSPRVLYAEPDLTRKAAALPNDTHFNLEWGLDNTGQTADGDAGTPDADIDAPEAWDINTGSSAITAGILDTGIDAAHPDLSPNIWANPGESGGGRETNGVDDDGNGLVDDAHGWDWVDGDADTADDNGHGTHTAGTLGARGNDGVGVAGVGWTIGLAPLRVLDSNGNGNVSHLILAYSYARAKGFRVVNGSLGSGGFSAAERDALAAAPNTLFVFAAGNGSLDNDSDPTYPCSYNLPNVLCVAASDGDDGLASFSNYGATTVHLAAPGERIVSTWPASECGAETPPCWAYSDGTSRSAPFVAGAAALVWGLDAAASVATVRSAILDNVDPKPGLAGKTVTGGRLNAFRAVASVQRGGSGSGSGGSPPPSPPAVAADRIAPLLVLRLARRHDLRAALRRGLLLRVHCSEACELRGELLVGRTAIARYVLIGQGRGGARQAGWTALRVRVTPRGRRILRRRRTMLARVRVRAADSSGNARRLSRRVLLR
jgi:subtilisin family serine protease